MTKMSWNILITKFERTKNNKSTTRPIAVGRRKQIVAQEDLYNFILIFECFVYFKMGQSSNRFHFEPLQIVGQITEKI